MRLFAFALFFSHFLFPFVILFYLCFFGSVLFYFTLRYVTTRCFCSVVADTLYVQNNAFTGDWPQEFCDTVDNFGLDCDKVECSCCDKLQCYYSKFF